MKLVTFKPGERDYEIWERGCADLSDEQLDRGVRGALDFKHPWFRLNDFRALCKGSESDYGIPDAHQAYIEACMAPFPKFMQKYSHPIVYHAGVQADWGELQRLPESKGFQRYKYFFDLLKQRALNGEKFSIKVPEPLPDPKHKPSTPESENYKKFKALKENF